MVGSIFFDPLQRKHFPLLCKWLNTSHVHKWWGENHVWSMEDIEAKYNSYVDHYKLIEGVRKPIFPYIIQYQALSIGFIQYYNVHDFPHDGKSSFKNLPPLTASLDVYIGEQEYLGKGLGVLIVKEFINTKLWQKFNFCFVDPEKKNYPSVRTFRKLHFQEISQDYDEDIVCMIKSKNGVINSSDLSNYSD